jgi:hypothetical protein
MMASPRITFHIEIDDDHYNAENLEAKPDQVVALENEAIAEIAPRFAIDRRSVRLHGRRPTDGALICSFRGESLDKVRKIIDSNRIVEGNDIQIVTGPVTVFDFEDSDGEPVWNQGNA